MINGTLRPWGQLTWLLSMSSLQGKHWVVLGCLSTQDRCLSVLSHAGRSYKLAHADFLEIRGEPSRFSVESDVRRAKNRLGLESTVPENQRTLVDFELFEPILRLKRWVDALTKAGSQINVILDVSALPEQFYFPLLRWLLEARTVENLIVTYMLPEKYTSEDLAYNAREWAQLPTFIADQTSDPAVENVIVGVGFLPFNLPELLKKAYVDPSIKVSLILPFPSAPSNVSRGWEFVRRIESNMTLRDDRQVARVDAHDISACFDRLQTITDKGRSPSVFAPYGPKTHSVAMCLQAINMDAEVFYTHPTFYHPEYSTGVGMSDGLPAGFAYAVRLRGQSLYQ